MERAGDVETDRAEGGAEMNEEQDDAATYPTCKRPAEPAHICPFKSEINDDEETLCTCCPECTQECAWDI